MPTAKTLACVTMAYNEADMLPIWLKHYGRQAKPANCFVLDHGSDDGSTANLGGAHLLRLARSPLDELSRGPSSPNSATACCSNMTTSPSPIPTNCWLPTPPSGPPCSTTSTIPTHRSPPRSASISCTG